jgi:hypothetical protein
MVEFQVCDTHLQALRLLVHLLTIAHIELSFKLGTEKAVYDEAQELQRVVYEASDQSYQHDTPRPEEEVSKAREPQSDSNLELIVRHKKKK